ncbi:glycosyltransferase family 4 protein [Cupriavidus plantarum]|uniref:glycosyltransferase family 4 protein n=1 Tax=Cupriavidus plantarum TaxID=942865 RepID=UPI001B0061FD|nr:glycosyltransferase family 1 protein [Cupriavidus plantarum]CAG2135330.1 D-inositol-3-phosphate glycosyltransferase [Cupriavidus plantarum]SMR84552.1 Glycosyltransferase involved in cell wall bisynthesis [Cupriavidus plantarum]
MPATVAINGRFLGRQATGVDRFAHEVVRCIDQLVAEQDPATAGLAFELLVPPDVSVDARQFPNLRVRHVGRGGGQLWEQVSLPLAAGGALLLNLCNAAPLFYPNQVTVMHDAAPVRVPQAYSRAFRSWYGVMAPWVGRVARRVLTVSEFSRREIASAYRIPGRKIGVLPLSGDHMLRLPEAEDVRRKFGLSDRPYVLAVSSASYHKNFRLVSDAVGMLGAVDYDVVIVGGGGRVFQSVREEANALADARVKRLGYVDDADLKALFRGAGCFVFPSLYEGYGLPPVEAMTLGCPVLAANLPSVREACGPAVLYFQPTSPREFGALLTRVMQDSALREKLREKGLVRARRYSWRDTAARLLGEISPWLPQR